MPEVKTSNVSTEQAIVTSATPGPPRGWLVGAIKAPFQDQNWIGRYWIVPVLALVPVINLIMLRGWRLENTANLARQRTPSLPAPELFFIFLLKGALLWLMTAVYHAPHAVFLLIHAAQLFHAAEQGQDALIHELAVVGIVTVAASIITWPLYRIAMMRYAATGSLWSFVLVPQNAIIGLRYMHLFIGLWFCAALLNIVNLLILGALSLTGIGVLVALVFTVPIYYAATAHLYAQVASRIALGRGWFVPVAAEAAAGPREHKRMGVVRVALSLCLSAGLLIAALAGAAGLAVWLTDPLDEMDPAVAEVWEAWRAGDWVGGIEPLRELSDRWVGEDAWLELLPEDIRDQLVALMEQLPQLEELEELEGLEDLPFDPAEAGEDEADTQQREGTPMSQESTD
jgi:hypothetical protein